MQPVRIGVLSDTHLSKLTPAFEQLVDLCFSSVSMIFHAGDLTDPHILKAFKNKKVHAVHGNMCSTGSLQALPRKKTVTVGKFTIGLIHNTGYAYNFEDQLSLEFDEVDCIIYGHTHTPTCHKSGGILYLNPGSFQTTGRFGAPGTFAILEADTELKATLYEVPALR
nr:metallophosphoesterase family protein [Desulfobulbaceae bacterium]